MDCVFYTNDCERFDCCECELNEEKRIKMTTFEKIKEEIFNKSVQMHFDGNYYIKVATITIDEETNKPIIKYSDVFDIIDKYIEQAEIQADYDRQKASRMTDEEWEYGKAEQEPTKQREKELEEAKEVIKAYHDKLTNSASNQLDGDIKAFELAIKALEQEPCDDVVSRKAVLECATLITSIPTEDWDIGDWVCLFRDRVSQLPSVRPQKPIPEQWQELKETILEMRDNDGTSTQRKSANSLLTT